MVIILAQIDIYLYLYTYSMSPKSVLFPRPTEFILLFVKLHSIHTLEEDCLHIDYNFV